MEEEVKIIFEDKDLLVLNKPAGWVTTAENLKPKDLKSKNVEGWLSERKPNGLAREGIVHRLDKGTSGILVVAKTESVLTNLKSQFKNRRVIKKYWALVSGEAVSGDINMPIGRSKYQFSRFGVKTDGKTAVTEFRVIKRMMINNRKYSLMEINLKTGRTHQIRVHMSYLGWPLVGDKLYGGEMIGLDRPFLQSKYLKLLHPTLGKEMEFKVDPSNDLIEFLSNNGEKV